jgi:hypothetical protein
MTQDDLQQYSNAWNNHDIDAIMAFMTDDCVFETGGGHQRFGSRFEGPEAVRARFIEVWTDISDVCFTGENHIVDGNKGCSEWTLTGTAKDGSGIDVDGCDIFTFVGDKIQSKRSYLKNIH